MMEVVIHDAVNEVTDNDDDEVTTKHTQDVVKEEPKVVYGGHKQILELPQVNDHENENEYDNEYETHDYETKSTTRDKQKTVTTQMTHSWQPFEELLQQKQSSK